MALIRTARAADAPAIAGIYARYVIDTAITFELDPPDAAAMTQRMADVQATLPWLVAEGAGGITLGYAYAAPFHARPAYRWIVTTAIYLAPAAQGRGLGRSLYGALLAALQAQGIVAATGLIALPNAASVGLHEALGFRHVGTFAGAGYKHGRWHDVGYWQAELAERPDFPEEPLPPQPLA